MHFAGTSKSVCRDKFEHIGLKSAKRRKERGILSNFGWRVKIKKKYPQTSIDWNQNMVHLALTTKSVCQ